MWNAQASLSRAWRPNRASVVVLLDRVDQEVHFVKGRWSLCNIVIARSNICLSAALVVVIPGLTTCERAAESDVDDLANINMHGESAATLTIFIFFHALRMSQFCGTKLITGVSHLLGSGLSLLMSAGTADFAKCQILMPPASICVAQVPPPFLLKESPKVP